jgi:hypothetical protein
MGIKSWHVLVVVLGVTAPVLPALAAPDARAVADGLAAAAAATGRVQATYDEATANGDVITISGFKIVRTDAKTISVPSVIVTGAAMRTPGGFTATSIAFDEGTAKRGEDIVTWKTGVVEDAVVPSAEEIKAETDFRPFGKLVVSGLTIAESNLAKPVTADEIRVVMDNDADGYPTAFAAQITGIEFGVEVLADRPQEKAIIDALGYESFDVNINVAGAFDRQNETMTLETFTINTAEVGTVSIEARFGGMSSGKIAAARLDSQARSDAKLESLQIRFDNAGVEVNAALPLVLHFIGNDAFQAKVATAVQAFLADPKSISFSARPTEPVSLEQILKSNRSGLPDLLSADVSTN